MAKNLLKGTSPYANNLPTNVNISTFIGAALYEYHSGEPVIQTPYPVTPGDDIFFQIQYLIEGVPTKVAHPYMRLTYTNLDGIQVSYDMYDAAVEGSYVLFPPGSDLKPGNDVLIPNPDPNPPPWQEYIPSGTKIPYYSGQDSYAPNSRYYTLDWGTDVAKPNTVAFLSFGYYATASKVDPIILATIYFQIGESQPWLLIQPETQYLNSNGFSSFVVSSIIVNGVNLLNRNSSVIHDPVNDIDITQGALPLYAPVPVDGSYPQIPLNELSGIETSANLKMYCWTYPIPATYQNVPGLNVSETATAFFNLNAIAGGGWDGQSLAHPITITLFLGSPTLPSWNPFTIAYDITLNTYYDKPLGVPADAKLVIGDSGIYQNGYYDITVNTDLTMTISPINYI